MVAGESLHSAFAFRELLVRGAVDAVQPNVARAGGLTECARIGDLARLFNVKVSPHGVGSALGIVTALHWCATLPHLLNYEANQFPNPLREHVLKQPVALQEGQYVVPHGPGL